MLLRNATGDELNKGREVEKRKSRGSFFFSSERNRGESKRGDRSVVAKAVSTLVLHGERPSRIQERRQKKAEGELRNHTKQSKRVSSQTTVQPNSDIALKPSPS